MVKNLKKGCFPLWIMSCTFLPTIGHASSFVECLTNGFETGTSTAQQFCNTLENAYNNGVTTQLTMETSERLCHGALTIACRAGLRLGIASRPLCRDLVSSNWNDSSQNMREFMNLACSN